MNVKEGQKIVFSGYSEEPEDGVHLLAEGDEYTVLEVNAADKSVVVSVDNPTFNAKKKESESNPKTILVDVFEEEFTVPKAAGKAAAVKAAPAKGKAKPAPAEEEPEEEEEEPEEDEEEEEEEAPAPAPKGKAKTSAKEPAPAKGKAATKEAAPAKGKAAAPAKGKAAAPAKGKLKPVAPKVADESDPYADLEEDSEDSEILGMIDDAEDILDLAKEMAEEASAIEYKLGGVLFHIRKSGAYKSLDDRYAEKGGFGLYVLEQLNVEYRKAMYLVDIYYKWNKFGLDAAKVAAIGWAKAAKIASVMTEGTADELLELAESCTVADLVENIKTTYKNLDESQPRVKAKLTVFKFKLFEDSAAGVEAVLSSVMTSMGFENLDVAFEHIVMEWASEHPVNEAPAQPKAKAPAKGAAKAVPTKARG